MATKASRPSIGAPTPMTPEARRVIFASSMGTVFEWYDFYLYGALAEIIARQFFSNLDPTSAFIFALLAFAAGFIVRPVGALVFGRFGDMIGRKYTFLMTIIIMGLATFLVGVLPSYATIGVAAPVILVILRLLQGFALGGEYGGAATYVAEHAPHGKRGLYTATVQTTATLGLLLSLMVIMGTRAALGEARFAAWGWRLPFLLSFVLLIISVWIRLSMNESPAFRRMKQAGRTSRAPISESFGQWRHLKVVVLALFGLVAGQAVVWYAGQFYALLFLTQTLKVEPRSAELLVAVALLIGTPFFLVFGALSDRIGRKPIIMTGLLLAALTMMPLFKALTQAANPALAAAQASSQVRVIADPAECSFQFNPTGTASFSSACDRAKQALALRAVNYAQVNAPPGTPAVIEIGTRRLPVAADAKVFASELDAQLRAAAYPLSADPAKVDKLKVVGILTLLVIYVTMVYGPLAATLVELFPTRIRYTSMSLPYHIGNGWFGGLLPPMAFAIVAQTGNIYSGLWYPIIVAGLSFVIGSLLIRETKDIDIYARD